jgi:hypothetical protein
MHPLDHSGTNPRGLAGPATVAVLLSVFGACGMRSALYELSADAQPGGGAPGAGGSGGTVVYASGGRPAAGGIPVSGGRPAAGGVLESGGRPASGGVLESGGRPASGGVLVSGGRPASGGRPVAGGSMSSGGSYPIDTRPSSGGVPGAGGGTPVDARPLTGGTPGSGGQGGTSVVRDASPDGDAKPLADVATPPPAKIDPNTGYATVNAGTVILSGYVVSSAGGSGSTITLTCTDTSFCATGAVGASTSYRSWANASFAVNQAQAGGSGSTASLPFVGSSITVSYVNKGGSSLQFELWDGSNFWCYYLPKSSSPNAVNVPFSSLNTSCWDGKGTAFVSGTPVVTVQLTVPGSNVTSTPFDFCFLGMTIQ